MSQGTCKSSVLVSVSRWFSVFLNDFLYQNFHLLVQPIFRTLKQHCNIQKLPIDSDRHQLKFVLNNIPEFVDSSDPPIALIWKLLARAPSCHFQFRKMNQQEVRTRMLSASFLETSTHLVVYSRYPGKNQPRTQFHSHSPIIKFTTSVLFNRDAIS